ncbi:MAG: hotdog domain-containing protein [Fervidobacterium sp.]|uniref:Predicted thioesterase n=1 Tax=Fervidobacterium gondwanense DSM 13020 TaxID=1121883 RepID=A0A1M7T0L0_FERGO|nr:hotdog domain-containing protein [Fervidobacterium gondwanense]UXF01122.1 thioesterase [Fervidobacterium riparium]SHN64293.1 Predicted thioesterase [Fervidobacterium gondwanense DSM 13020]
MKDLSNILGLNKSVELNTNESMVWEEEEELSYLHLVSTSSLLKEVSHVTYEFLGAYIDEEETSVVTDAEISHLKPVVVGENLIIGARITDIVGNRVLFKFVVMRESEKIAEGTLTRVVVSKNYLKRKAVENF